MNIMFLYQVLFLLLSSTLCDASVNESIPTYERQDPSTGEVLVCTRCPPGTHMAAHCTATKPTECAPCKEDHFTELWNYLPRCLYCNNFCYEKQEVETECSATSNRVCRCKEGFYSSDDFCIRHAECAPGLGVKTRGTPQKNTVCEICAEGYFSNSSSALDSCIKHQECATGQIALLKGSIYHDTLCGTCEDLASGGETYRKFLSTFFSMHRMRVSKMKRFVARYIHKSAEERRIRSAGLPRQRGPLLDQIRAWLAEAPREQLRKMPMMLKASHLNSMAEKLQKTLSDIQQQATTCSVV